MIKPSITKDATSGVYGFVDSIDEKGISGWILDLDGGVNVVEVYINDVKAAEKEANLHREDIGAMVGKETNCGFFITWKEIRLSLENMLSSKFEVKIVHKRTSQVIKGNYKIATQSAKSIEEYQKLKKNQALMDLDDKLKEEYNIIKESGLFDEEYYLENNSDVKQSGIDPLYHFVKNGWKEGRNPSRHFDLRMYKLVNQDVKDINPLLHYIKYGAKEFRLLKPFSKEKHVLNINVLNTVFTERWTNEFIHEFVSKRLTDPIDIIIPVYNAYDFLNPLLSSVIKNTNIPYRLLICDDCSSDERVYKFLNQFKMKNTHIDILLFKNTKNLGFVKTVNKLATISNNHFVILNMDTEVPSGWLERLIFPILYFDRVASVTPFSNSATICSFPEFLKDNDLYIGLDTDTIDKYFKNVDIERTIQTIPSGVGFCMAINKDVYKIIGLFDETFGRGYGEENDWCMKASLLGYKNVIATNLFVYHKHGASFGKSKEVYDLKQKNLNIILQRYPSYQHLVDYFISLDPLKPIRDAIKIKILSDMHQAVFIVDHSLGGGANEYTVNITKDLEIYMILKSLYHDEGKIVLEVGGNLFNKNIEFYLNNYDELNIVFDKFKIQKLVINNLYSFPNVTGLIDKLLEISKNRKIEAVYNLHDYYCICPSPHLINQHNDYCGIPDKEDICNECIKTNKLYINRYDKQSEIRTFRASFEKLLNAVDKIRVFSRSSVEILSKVYNIPEYKFEYLPHKVDYVRPVKVDRSIKHKDVLNIGVLGSIGPHKGSEVIKNMISYIDKHFYAKIKIHIIGELYGSEEIKYSKSVIIYGKYNKRDLPEIIEGSQIDIIFIPSIWPETFCYTAEEAMKMNMPLVIFNIGAPYERVYEYNYNKVLILDIMRKNNTEYIIESILKFIKEVN